MRERTRWYFTSVAPSRCSRKLGFPNSLCALTQPNRLRSRSHGTSLCAHTLVMAAALHTGSARPRARRPVPEAPFLRFMNSWTNTRAGPKRGEASVERSLQTKRPHVFKSWGLISNSFSAKSLPVRPSVLKRASLHIDTTNRFSPGKQCLLSLLGNRI